MFANIGLTTPPCGVPRFRSIVVPSSCTIGALSHLSMYSSAHLHVTCLRVARNRSSWSMLSKDPTTHYPPQGPSRACHHHSATTSIGREKTGCLWATALPGQVTSDSDFAQRRSLTRTQGVD